MRTVGPRSFSVFLSMLLLAVAAFPYETDDTLPEVTDRVARISFIRGEVQIRRDGSDDWEKADPNLPIVEGDELSTDADARVEIQFNSKTHLRLAENSYIQVKTLGDEGIAISVSRGSASVRLRKFDMDKEYFEVDAPNTTVAIQREGVYRIDAESKDEREVRVSVTEGGEARVYSTNSGFTLKSGRSAKLLIEGDLAGEWETADAGRYADEFDSWSSERDDKIAKLVQKADYDKYYDQDIYGAEDLNDNGDWEYTGDYGYVWRPNDTAIRGYSDWSPYRYGTWRWVPPFGWTWVNDEPWGWATYHHGRWIWYRNRWVWTPYGQYRSSRSWWYPALVVVRVINRNVCWYPLGYGQAYSNYNGYHDWVGNRGRRDRRHDNRPPGNINPQPTPIPGPLVPKPRGKYVPVDPEIPAKGIVMLPEDDFGIGRKRPTNASPEIIKGVLAKTETQGQLPKYETVKPKLGRDILVPANPQVSKSVLARKTGAAERKSEAPLDKELRNSRFYGNRPPVTRMPANNETPPINGRLIPRDTGIVDRPRPPKREADVPTADQRIETPTKGTPRIQPPRERREEPKTETPSYEPPVRKEVPRVDPPVRRDPPRQETPKYEQPRNDPPRNDPPKREEPRSSPPQKSEPPPSKSPAPPSKSESGGGRKKDG